jgi:formamidopyrimidine-DNA glycosylase
MPECPEVTILSHYLNDKLKNKYITKLDVISGKYLNKSILGKKLLDGTEKYKIVNVNSKGKVLYITMYKLDDLNKNIKKYIYLMSHLGMSGEWSFKKSDSDRLNVHVESKDGKKYTLCYVDPRNFGNVEVLDSKDALDKRLNKLAPDVLKTNFTDAEFHEMVKKYLSKSKKRSEQSIFKVLTKQNLVDGIISGLGNYLIPEILYDAKISPYRTIGSLSESDIFILSHSIKYITKLSYYNNTTGYMTNFGSYSSIHKDGIDSGKYDNYHPDIILKSTDIFKFKIYQQKTDPFGNKVNKDKNKKINAERAIHWVSTVQI